MTCLILAGGLGTRLRSALPDLPKPMAPVHGRPFLEYLLADLTAAGIQHVVFCVGHKAAAIEEHFGSGAGIGVQIEYSRERELLDTAGAVKLAEPLLRSEHALLLNGDCYNAVDFPAFVAQHQNSLAAMTMLATQVAERGRFGSLVLGDDDRVLQFVEKGASTGAGFINSGYYVFKREVLDLVPAGQRCSLEKDVFPHLMQKGKLYAFRNHGDFIDIGLPEEWRRAEKVLPPLLSPEST
jgi:NDP-sugar pyrophosphorylase family protein